LLGAGFAKSAGKILMSKSLEVKILGTKDLGVCLLGSLCPVLLDYDRASWMVGTRLDVTGDCGFLAHFLGARDDRGLGGRAGAADVRLDADVVRRSTEVLRPAKGAGLRMTKWVGGRDVAGVLGDDVLGTAGEYRGPEARKERGPQDDRVVGRALRITEWVGCPRPL
jgi:hypothetical protein